MLRKLLISGLLAVVLAAPAAAKPTVLMPGVTYEKGVQFTPHGPVAIHIVRGPRPTGLYALRPTLSNEAIQGTERVTSMQKRLSPAATMVGVNGDFYAAGGRPSGVLMRDGVVESPPYGDRSSLGIAPEGAIDVRRVEFFGTWRGLGQRRTLNDLNQAPGPNGISLFTPSYGQTTPQQAGTIAAIIAPFPPTVPNTDLAGPVVGIAGGGRTAIPQGGAVLVARGTAAQRLVEEAPVGTTLALRIIFRPEWTGVTQAVGGGPVLVRNGGPVFRAQEAFTSSQLAPRAPRTAVGQRTDGSLIMVVTDGRRPGYSVGMSNFELAQTLVRLGAVTGSGLDGGGSSSLAFDGKLLSRPSDRGGERPVSNALQLAYYGVYAPAVTPVISPNGDGVDERQQALTYKVVRPSVVTTTLTAPDGTVPFAETEVPKTPGTYPVAFPPAPPPPADPAAPPPPPPAAPAEGRWQLAVRATDDQGQASQVVQSFTVNNTLGFTALSRRSLVLRPQGKATISAGITLTRAARMVVTVETAGGIKISTIAARAVPAGRYRVSWTGRVKRSLVYGGMYRIRFRANTELGIVELATKPFRVIRAAPVKKKPAKPDS
ncbi:MAG TPA: phosphodiester glycosidase family protein [Gaiellaceae bacterium]|nr:phosphodiester glycosidase family protein [Gaiellaceae bacterium]